MGAGGEISQLKTFKSIRNQDLFHPTEPARILNQLSLMYKKVVSKTLKPFGKTESNRHCSYLAGLLDTPLP